MRHRRGRQQKRRPEEGPRVGAAVKDMSRVWGVPVIQGAGATITAAVGRGYALVAEVS